ncbi:hypothetical protein AURDEDRAFT_116180 [Auricularia subglabra TFB-10046 SS5]|nr:hypothetical protein AURDEDRAFT_116180 [Auricularia subglabra TFB-10046 SS5]
MPIGISWKTAPQWALLLLLCHAYHYLRYKLAQILIKCGSVQATAGEAAKENEKTPEEQQQQQHQTYTRQYISPWLLLWALVVLPINYAALKAPIMMHHGQAVRDLFWAELEPEGPIDMDLLRLVLPGILPVLASVKLVFTAVLLPMQRTPFWAEEMRGIARTALLDGALGPPLYALCMAYRFHEHWVLVMGLSAAYVAQTAVWMYSYCSSRRESLERAAATGIRPSAPYFTS